MNLEAKVENPITLKLGNEEVIITSENEKLPLEHGAIFGGDHYGFHIVVEKDDQETTETYPTQCRIYGIQMANDQLCVFEEHKYLPWEFSSNGTLLSNAVFSMLKRDEIAYIAETYGVQTEEDLAELNDYRKAGKR